MAQQILDDQQRPIGRSNPLPVESYDARTDSLNVRSMQAKRRDNFPGGTLSSDWSVVLGAGASIGVASGALTINAGTTAGAETYLTYQFPVSVPARAIVAMALSSRIANQDWYLELVAAADNGDGKYSVPAPALITDFAAWNFSGISATTALLSARVQGNPIDTSTSQTIATTAAQALYEIETFVDESWFHQRAADTGAARGYSGVRQINSPDPNLVYFLRLRVKNSAVAPASSTAMTVKMVSVQDYQELTTEITASRGGAAAGQALPVSLVNSAPVSPYGSSGPNSTTNHRLLSAATTNATSVKTSAGRVHALVLSNASASVKYFKLYNKATAPTVGTDTPIMTVLIPAGQTIVPIVAAGVGVYCSSGIAYALTGGIADTDATAVAAADVIVNMGWA